MTVGHIVLLSETAVGVQFESINVYQNGPQPLKNCPVWQKKESSKFDAQSCGHLEDADTVKSESKKVHIHICNKCGGKTPRIA
jgi:hypothetical protein